MDLNALYKLTHGLYVLGAKDEKCFCGCIVDAVMQVANKPVAIALSCANHGYTKSCIDKTHKFSLSVLCKGIDPFVVANFGFQSSRNKDKWNNVNYFVQDDLPYLQNNLARFSCKVIYSYRLESNTLYIAEVISAYSDREAEPLTYLDYRSYFKDDVMKSFQHYQKQIKEKNYE